MGPARPDSLALLAEWRAFLQARDLGLQTIHHYTYAVWRLLEHHSFAVHPIELDEGHIVSFLASLGRRATAKDQYAKGIRSFCKWQHRRGYAERDPADYVRPRKPPRRPKVRLERGQARAMVVAARDRHPRRAAAIVACLALGARRSEFVSILLRDIDWDAGIVHLQHTKGGRPRDVEMGPEARLALIELMRWSDGDRLLAIEPNTLNAWVKQAAIDAGITDPRKQHAHVLRASFASWLADDGVPAHVIAELLGHQDVKTTSLYLAIGPGAKREAMDKADFALLRADASAG